jgi:hypothetical protein
MGQRCCRDATSAADIAAKSGYRTTNAAPNASRNGWLGGRMEFFDGAFDVIELKEIWNKSGGCELANAGISFPAVFDFKDASR